MAPNAGICRPEELYDLPQLGSPRAVSQRRSASPLHLQDDIGVGSLVEVATDVDQNYYGVVRWIGLIDGKDYFLLANPNARKKKNPTDVVMQVFDTRRCSSRPRPYKKFTKAFPRRHFRGYVYVLYP